MSSLPLCCQFRREQQRQERKDMQYIGSFRIWIPPLPLWRHPCQTNECRQQCRLASNTPARPVKITTLLALTALRRIHAAQCSVCGNNWKVMMISNRQNKGVTIITLSFSDEQKVFPGCDKWINSWRFIQRFQKPFRWHFLRSPHNHAFYMSF